MTKKYRIIIETEVLLYGNDENIADLAKPEYVPLPETKPLKRRKRFAFAGDGSFESCYVECASFIMNLGFDRCRILDTETECGLRVQTEIPNLLWGITEWVDDVPASRATLRKIYELWAQRDQLLYEASVEFTGF